MPTAIGSKGVGLFVLGFFIAACSAQAPANSEPAQASPSPTPTASPTPSPTPIPTPTPEPWTPAFQEALCGVLVDLPKTMERYNSNVSNYLGVYPDYPGLYSAASDALSELDRIQAEVPSAGGWPATKALSIGLAKAFAGWKYVFRSWQLMGRFEVAPKKDRLDAISTYGETSRDFQDHVIGEYRGLVDQYGFTCAGL